jgi:hypothetical protein
LKNAVQRALCCPAIGDPCAWAVFDLLYPQAPGQGILGSMSYAMRCCRGTVARREKRDAREKSGGTRRTLWLPELGEIVERIGVVEMSLRLHAPGFEPNYDYAVGYLAVVYIGNPNIFVQIRGNSTSHGDTPEPWPRTQSTRAITFTLSRRFEEQRVHARC